MSVKTLLIIPPKYELSFPPLGTPALLGHLKSKGKVASQMDLNHAYARHFLSQIELSEPVSDPDQARFFSLKPLMNQSFEKKASQGVYFSHALFNPLPFSAYEDDTDGSYHFAENLLDADYLERFLTDQEHNSFLQFYREKKIGEQIVNLDIDLLGISIIGPSMIIPTLTLAKYLKENFQHSPKIVLGGQWCTLYKKQWQERAEWTKYIDYLIYGEGETPLLNLIEHLEGNQRLEAISNLIYAQGGEWKKTIPHSKEKMRVLPMPDFEGLPLNQYRNFTGPQIGLTYETSRECYWNRCTYCVDIPMPHEGYRVKPVQQVVDEIAALMKKYNPDYLIFSDPAMAPSRLKAISEEMIKRNLHIPYWCFGRLESNFSKETFEIAKQAGCDEIDYGMETANQRLMDFVDKGTKVEEISRIIKETADAGIKVSLQVIFRFPTESYEEGLETVHFLADHGPWIHDTSVNIYYLTPGNHMFNDPARFRIKLAPNQPKFRFFHRFQALDEKTMSYEDAFRLQNMQSHFLGVEKDLLDQPHQRVEARLMSAGEEMRLPLLVFSDGRAMLSAEVPSSV